MIIKIWMGKQLIRFILGLFIVSLSADASVYAINIGTYEKKQSALKTLHILEKLARIDASKLTILERQNHNNGFLLRSQDYISINDAKVQEEIIKKVVDDAYIIKRKSSAKPLKESETNTNKDDAKIYEDAIIEFNDKKYQDSFNLLSKIILRHLSDKNMNFYLGRSAFELKLYDVALSAYERILMAEPNNLRTRLEFARTLFFLKNYKDAKKEFKNIAKLDLSKNVRANVERYVGLLENLTKKRAVTGMVMGGWSYDSNANNGALENSYFLPLINDTLASTASKSDTAHQEVVALTHIKKINNTLALKNSFMGFAKTMTNQTDKNVALVGWTPSLVYKSKKTIADIALGYNTMWFGSDSYLSTYMFNPKFSYIVDKTLMLTSQYKWQRKKNEQTLNKERDANVNGVYIGFSKKLPFDISTTMNYSYEQERRVRGERTDVDQNIYTLSIGIVKAWDRSLSFNIGYNFRNPNYTKKDRSFFTKREDRNRTYSIGFSKKLQKTLVVNGKYSRVKNISNQGPFSYEKDIVGFNIVKLFI